MATSLTMDSMSPLSIPLVLKQAVEHRIEGLEHARESFKRRYHLDADHAAEYDVALRISKLLEDVEKLDPDFEDGFEEWTPELMKRFIGQAQHDKSISEARLLNLEHRLRTKLKKHLNRMEVSSLHADLIKEVIKVNESTDEATAKLEVANIDDEFEMVEDGIEQILEEFEKRISTPINVDPEATQTYLMSLFNGEEDGSYLQCIRSSMKTFGDEFADPNTKCDQDSLIWAILDLMKKELISEETRETLGKYLQSPIALQELVSTLKMKTVRNWTYNSATKGLQVTARQHAEGHYCMVVEEGVIDMLFLHCIAIGWASHLKECLKDASDGAEAFKSKPLDQTEVDKRSYFLEPPLMRPQHPQPYNGACTICHPYNSYPPVPPPPEPFNPYQIPPPPPPLLRTKGSRKKSKKLYPMQIAPPPPVRSRVCELNRERRTNYLRNFFMSHLPTFEGSTPEVVSPEEVQGKLIKTLAVECKLRGAFDGKIHASAQKFDCLSSSIPHKTIVTVLKFLGVPEASLGLFTRFLETGVRIGSGGVLEPACGVFVGHGMELFFSEAVLFFLELAVHKKTGSYLYRLRDRCYFIGTEEQTKAADEEIARFSEIMGLKTHEICLPGTLSIGFLTLDLHSPGSSVLSSIDDAKVTAYAHRIKTQLEACATVLDWVNVWNSSVGTYAAHLFGPLAVVFGKRHLEVVKASYNRIHSIIFGGSDLTTHVKTLLSSHVNGHLRDSPLALEAFIYLPQSYGGMGVKNHPFIAFSLAHEISENPHAEIEKYLAEEDVYYSRAAAQYDLFNCDQRQQKLEDVFDNDPRKIITTLGLDPSIDPLLSPISFLTKQDLFKERERAPYPAIQHVWEAPLLAPLYRSLLNEPLDHIEHTKKVGEDVRRLSGRGGMRNWHRLSGEDRWVLQMYSDECFEQYGTLEIWWREGMPLEVYMALRAHAVDEDDDDSSCESV
jgi:hypothetical protein